MTPFAIQSYDVVLSVHIMAVVLGFGPTFAYAVMAALAHQDGGRNVPFYVRTIMRIDRYLVLPGMLVLLLTGLYLATLADGPYDLKDTWVSATFAILLGILALQFLVFAPGERRSLELAERDLGGGQGRLSPEYDAAAKRLAIAGSLAGVLVLVAIFLMTTKPG